MEHKKTFYVTTPIYYPTAKPHLGTAYTTIAADILARWHRLVGEEVFFLTGTDEHGEKLDAAAKTAGKAPKEYVDNLVKDFKNAWKKLNITFNGFIRTTDKEHEETVKKIINKIYEKGDLYEGNYEGWYCTPCESYWTEKDLVNEKCPSCGRDVKLFKEKAYFFRLSKFQKKLLELYAEKPDFILPETKRNEVVSRVKEGLKDVSFTRSKFKWGVELPQNKDYVIWVWADALANYISAVGWPDKPNFKKFWPANVHIIGKDILWFHAVIWPAMLMSAGVKVPKTIFAHGWWTVDGEKMSKSKGNVVDPLEVAGKYGVDTLRYHLFRETSFGNDGNFSEKMLIERHNSELADKLGNLVSRVSTLAEKYGVEKTKNLLLKKLNLKQIEKEMAGLKLEKVLTDVFAFVDDCNEYIQSKKPWESDAKDRKKVLYQLIDSIKSIAILLWPFMPSTSEKIAEHFGFAVKYENIEKALAYKKIKKADILFKKIDVKETPDIKSVQKKDVKGDTVEIEDFQKLKLKIATVTKAEKIEGSDKLYKLEIEFDKEKRTIVAGVAKYYNEKEIVGKQIVVLSNLKPANIKGVESNGMLLAAEKDGEVALLVPDRKIKNGAEIH